MRTSVTHPLQIASVQSFPGMGQIGITLCPGKKQPQAATGAWDRDLGLDLDAIAAWGAVAVVTLVEEHELASLHVLTLGAEVAARRMQWLHLPIRDASVPTDEFEARWQEVGEALRARLRDGFSVLVHCKGGLGRAGTIAARLLIELGVPPQEAVMRVRNVRPGAIETPEQEAHVLGLKAVPEPEPATTAEAIRDRAVGCLLGQLAGDALGAQVEFLSPTEIRKRHPQGVKEMRPGGTWGLLAGQITDDSEMALALARSLVAEGGFQREAVARAYIAWGASQPFDVGGTTRAGLEALAGRGQPNAQSQANGALMRVSPIGIAAAGAPALAAKWAREDATLTHPHPVCLASSAAFAAAIAAGMSGAEPTAMWIAAHEHAGEDAGAEVIRTCLAKAQEAEPSDFVRHQGWVLIAFQNAFHRLWSGQAVEGALVETISAGGDTDTNAAICGALLGAAQGRDAIPLRWRQQVLSCQPEKVAGVKHPRPAAYWGANCMTLAKQLLVSHPR